MERSTVDQDVDDWRATMVRRVALTLLLKLAALVVLWFLFFSPSHRVEVTPDTVRQQLFR